MNFENIDKYQMIVCKTSLNCQVLVKMKKFLNDSREMKEEKANLFNTL